MRYQTLSDGNREFIEVTVRNKEASATISRGQPVALTMSGTEDGCAVALPSTALANATAFGFGVAVDSIAVDALGKAQVFGFNRFTAIVRATRGASTDSWASAASSAMAIPLAIVSQNYFSGSAGTGGTAYSFPYAALAETLASYASSASATSDTRTAITAGAKSFLRMM